MSLYFLCVYLVLFINYWLVYKYQQVSLSTTKWRHSLSVGRPVNQHRGEQRLAVSLPPTEDTPTNKLSDRRLQTFKIKAQLDRKFKGYWFVGCDSLETAVW